MVYSLPLSCNVGEHPSSKVLGRERERDVAVWLVLAVSKK
jgi:hypothetical protein